MAKRRTAAQIQAAVKAVQRDLAKGLTVGDSCRRHGLNVQSYYRWRRRKADASDETTARIRELATEAERIVRMCVVGLVVWWDGLAGWYRFTVGCGTSFWIGRCLRTRQTRRPRQRRSRGSITRCVRTVRWTTRPPREFAAMCQEEGRKKKKRTHEG